MVNACTIYTICKNGQPRDSERPRARPPGRPWPPPRAIATEREGGVHRPSLEALRTPDLPAPPSTRAPQAAAVHRPVAAASAPPSSVAMSSLGGASPRQAFFAAVVGRRRSPHPLPPCAAVAAFVRRRPPTRRRSQVLLEYRRPARDRHPGVLALLLLPTPASPPPPAHAAAALRAAPCPPPHRRGAASPRSDAHGQSAHRVAATATRDRGGEGGRPSSFAPLLFSASASASTLGEVEDISGRRGGFWRSEDRRRRRRGACHPRVGWHLPTFATARHDRAFGEHGFTCGGAGAPPALCSRGPRASLRCNYTITP
ncbi:atherin-like [Ananas comosus]|uniref:Atherin-like n=1 Tax=Ananas comosus TaxID=4615 RepID=A0A6P5GN23_ANACO|nr:atherin-like [Ananas comosus]